MSKPAEYDVIVVGASAAGCATATLFSQNGLRVALVERRPDINSYKKACTHYIQASATPTIQKMGLAPLIEEAGAIRNRIENWTRWGWIRHATDDRFPKYGYNIRRETLDPVLRAHTANQPNVSLFLGHSVEHLVFDSTGRVTGITARRLEDSQRITFNAPLTVGADGYQSQIAKLANVPTKTKPNNRFIYWSYFRNVPDYDPKASSKMWLCDPDAAYYFPCDDGVSLVALMITKDKLEAFKEDIDGNFEKFLSPLPEMPRFWLGERASTTMGMLEYPIIDRQATAPGLALVGDAAMSSDPVWGVGVGWAFQSADWLVSAVSIALANGLPLDPALAKYADQHKNMLGMHNTIISDFAAGQPMTAFEKLYFSAACFDQQTAVVSHALGNRHISPMALFAPKNLFRALWTVIKHRPKMNPEEDFNFVPTPRPVPTLVPATGD